MTELLVDRKANETTQMYASTCVHTHTHTPTSLSHSHSHTLLSHDHKEEFMVGFNYLRDQIKRTKCASQEFSG